jgi:hypothetical protein
MPRHPRACGTPKWLLSVQSKEVGLKRKCKDEERRAQLEVNRAVREVNHACWEADRPPHIQMRDPD